MVRSSTGVRAEDPAAPAAPDAEPAALAHQSTGSKGSSAVLPIRIQPERRSHHLQDGNAAATRRSVEVTRLQEPWIGTQHLCGQGRSSAFSPSSAGDRRSLPRARGAARDPRRLRLDYSPSPLVTFGHGQGDPDRLVAALRDLVDERGKPGSAPTSSPRGLRRGHERPEPPEASRRVLNGTHRPSASVARVSHRGR
jgi:hypothetical protein